MAVRRGKRRRRDRRRREFDPSGEEQQAPEPKPVARAPTKRRGPKPMAERSPLTPAAFSVLCFAGAGYSLVNGYGKSGLTLVIFAVYIGLGFVEAFVAFRVFRARGGWK